VTGQSDFSIENSVSAITSGLLRRAKLRESTAWETLVHAYSPLVYVWCRRRLPQPADAENVGQEVFCAVAEAVTGFEGDANGFRAWLSRITHNKIVDFWRGRQKEPAAMGGSDARRTFQQIPAVDAPHGDNLPTKDDLSTEDENRLVFRRLTESIRQEFETTTWKAFCEVFVKGRSPSDVAADLQISRNAVYLAKSRVLRRLRQQVADFEAAGLP
jgi:RNA polymerase sigma-70 factor (ECF subfamily)